MTEIALAPIATPVVALSPASPASWVIQMQEDWPLIGALLRRTKGMRARRELSLPKWPKEPEAAYEFRLKNSTCYGFYADAVNDLAARPFERPVAWQGTPSPEIEAVLGDVNGEGCSLEQFGKAWLSLAAAYGVAHVWVDYSLSAPAESLAEERAQRARPVLRLLPQSAVVDASVDRSGRITHLRVLEFRPERTGYEEVEIAHVLEWNLVGGSYEYKLHRRARTTGEWSVVEGPQPYPLDELPIATLNLSQGQRFRAQPPLLSLAEMEDQHWRTQSDHLNNLSIVSAGGIFVAGISEDEHRRGFVLGPSAFNSASDPNAKATWLEPQGGALEQRALEIKRIESRMREMAARPMVEQVASRTATEVASGDARSQTLLQSWVRLLEAAMLDAAKAAALWLQQPLPEDFKLQCFSDWGATQAQGEHLRALEAGRARRDIDHETYLAELQRRGVLSTELNLGDVVAAAKAEAEPPDLGGLDGSGVDEGSDGSGDREQAPGAGDQEEGA